MAMTAEMRVFISYKHHGKDGEVLPDYWMAKELHEALLDCGITSFFSSVSVIECAQNDYKALIDESLDDANVLVLVGTKPEHCISSWVRYEWDSFFNDLLGGREGRFVSYLDNDDIRSFHRTIRSNEVFQKKEDGLNELVKFIKNYVSQIEGTETYSGKGSSYNYRTGDEKRRLSEQAKVELRMDYDIIDGMVSSRDGDVCNVLDIGCSTGTVTFRVFGKYGDSVRVIGVDKFEECVMDFNHDRPDGNMAAYLLDLEDDDWDDRLRAIMDEEMIPSFDLVYCSLSLHHMSDSGSVLKKVRNLMSDGGHVFIRTCDDALKLAYPGHDMKHEIIRETSSLPGAPDRYHSRKMYSQLLDAGFSDIRMDAFIADTCDMDADARAALFATTFTWRRNMFLDYIESRKDDVSRNRAKDRYGKVLADIDKVEQLFADRSFYFGYCVTIATAVKKNVPDQPMRSDSAPHELHVEGLALGPYLGHHLPQGGTVAGDDHHLEALLVHQMGVHLGLYVLLVPRLYLDDPRVGVVPPHDYEDALDGALHGVQLPDLLPGGVQGEPDGLGPPLEAVGGLDGVQDLRVFVV